MEGRSLEEQKLIERSRDGDVEAFEELVRIHQRTALRVAYLVVRGHTEAEAATRDAFVEAHRSLRRLPKNAPFRPWLLALVRRESLRHVGGPPAGGPLELREAGDPPVSGRNQADVLRALDSLPTHQSDVLSYRFLLGLSEAETSKVLGISIGAVRSRTSRAVASLQTALRHEETDET